MKLKDAISILSSFAEVYPDADLTFANNKVPVTKIVYEETTGRINLR